MEVIYERCCGLDVHKDKIVACVLSDGNKEIKTYGTVTDDLLSLLDWIKSEGCQMVAMESTGSYWKPVYNLLELEGIPAMVVNAQHIKAVPGRKTDVKDAEWIADLLKHGLLKGSYIPSREQRELKELVRYRRSMIDERARELNRLQKVLEGANIKLGSVVSDINGVSSRQMLRSMINGEDDTDKLVLFAKGKMKGKTEELKRSLKGLMGKHQRMILSQMLDHIDYLDNLIHNLDEEIKERMRPFEKEVAALDAITGVGERSAQTIIAEIGTDMSVFPSAGHLASWAGMCPGNNESAGKKKSGKTRKGNNTLRCTLAECAKAAGRSKDTYLSAQYKRIAARRGRNRAAVAVGHTILTIAYHIIKNNTSYKDLGADYFDQKRKEDIARKALKRLEALGYKVTIEEAAV
jgi:transposase